MENKQIITLAYELAKSKYGKNTFTFNQLWTDLVKKAKLDESEKEQVGHVYASMLQDQRFIFVGNQEWKIREFLTQKEQESYANSLYGFNIDAEEEGSEAKEAKKKQKLASIAEKEQAEQEIYYDDADMEEVYNESASRIDDEDADESDEINEEESADEDEEDEE